MKIKEYNEITFTECAKSQEVRLLDVFVIGPILIYGGIKYKKILPPWFTASLLIIGAATVYYNGKNYLETKTRNER